MITSLEELKNDRKLVNEIDWEMTPDMAVRMYLEWGNIWAHGDRRHVVRSKNDYSVYFTVFCWDRPFYISLYKRNSEDAKELAKIELPERFENKICKLKGVYAVDDELREWLKQELNAA